MKYSIFLTMLFSLMMFVNDDASAQDLCSKYPDGNQINLMIGNAAEKAFTLNPVNEDCEETTSNKQIAVGDVHYFGSHNGAVFHVREVGTDRLLGELVVDPAKPKMLVMTNPYDNVTRLMYDEADEPIPPATEYAEATDPVPSAPDYAGNANNANGTLCSTKTSDNSVEIEWFNNANEMLQFRRVGEDCQEIAPFLSYQGDIQHGDNFRSTAHPGTVYRIYRMIESDESESELLKTITVTNANGNAAISGPNTVNEITVSPDQIPAFRKYLLGKWRGLKYNSLRIYDGNTFRNVNEGAGRESSNPYVVLDKLNYEVPGGGMIIQYTWENGFQPQDVMVIKDQDTMILHSDATKEVLTFKRIE